MSDTRREFLQVAAGLGGAAGSPAPGSAGGRGSGGGQQQQPATPPRPASEIQVPKMKFGGAEISRLICGCNTFYGFAHFNQTLGTVMREYFTPDRVCDMLHQCTRFGINTFNYYPDGRGAADQDPGAKEAGVVNYIDLQLSTRFKRHRAAYRQGISKIDAGSQAQFGKPFADLAGEQQVAVLKATEEKDRAFFDLLLNHTRQGFYGDPRHGGNRGMVSWKMLGLPYPQVRGRQHYDSPQAE